MTSTHWVGIFEGHWNPAVAIVSGGRVLAYMEEERLNRIKHSPRVYPLRALQSCLTQAGITPRDVTGIAVNWNTPAYSDGSMEAFFAGMARRWPIDGATRAWQKHVLGYFGDEATRQRHARHWLRAFGDRPVPRVFALPHHYTHAVQAFLQSPFEDAVCLTIDGSGDEDCTVVWDCRGDSIQRLRQIRMPHSLGWFYAAFTEYLGFQAYDGEYKLMGLAAYGQPNAELKSKVERVLSIAEDGIEYRVDPSFLHYGEHTWSERFTDDLVALLERPARQPAEPLTAWHHDLAFAVQAALEEAVCRLATWGLRATGSRNLCVGGGVGLNVKMNSRLSGLAPVTGFFAHPLCSDAGAAAGAALGLCWQQTGTRPERLTTLALGHEESEASIEQTLQNCRIRYERPDDLADAVAAELAAGRIVGWFQGRMEAGPRALGQRSILADARRTEARDRVNQAVKYREAWRPFCPSLPVDEANRYLERPKDAPFMSVSFVASAELAARAPAVVHVDNTARVQLVHPKVLPLFYRLLQAYKQKAGLPILLNTSFNINGEPIVCTITDAIRTFYGSGIDVLAAGPFLVRKGGG